MNALLLFSMQVCTVCSGSYDLGWLQSVCSGLRRTANSLEIGRGGVLRYMLASQAGQQWDARDTHLWSN